MLVTVAELVKETEKSFVVIVLDGDQQTNFSRKFCEQIDEHTYELRGFLKAVVAKHLAKHGALEVA